MREDVLSRFLRWDGDEDEDGDAEWKEDGMGWKRGVMGMRDEG